MNRNIARTVALTLAIAFFLSIMPMDNIEPVNAAYTPGTWTFPVVDDWGLSLAKGEARGYLYNSTGRSWESWALLAWGDVWTNDTGSYITFKNLRSTWNNTLAGLEITYSLVIKLKVEDKITPITIFNATVLSITPTYNASGPPYYAAFALKDLGRILQFGVDVWGPVTPIDEDGFSEPIEVWLYYKAFKLLDQMGLPVTVSDVEVYYSSSWDPPLNHTWITTSPQKGIYNAEYWSGVTNGTYDPPTNGLIPNQEWGNPPFTYFYDPDCKVGWVIVKLPLIDRTSLVSNMTFLFYYHGTLVANFTATYLVVPPYPGIPAWSVWGSDIYGTFDAAFHATTLRATLEANTTERVYCNIDWIPFTLWDQLGGPWPTRNAKITLYDVDVGSQYPWPGVISPDGFDEYGTSLVLLRFPVVNHTLKVVVTWFDNTVNVTYIDSDDTYDGGFDIDAFLWVYSGDTLPGIIVDMVKVWIKVFTSTQVPAPLDPNWVDEVKIRIESRIAPSTTYTTKLSYWHGYIILPDTPFGWEAGVGYIGYLEDWLAQGWLPSGNWSTIDFFVKYKGLEVVNTVTRYPVNGSLKLVCPGTPSDYGRTFILYAGVYDVGFKVLLGCENKSSPADPYTPLIMTTPDGQRILVTTDGQGVITLRDVPTGTYKDFTLLFKMMPLTCTSIKIGDKWEAYRPIKVNASTKPLIELLFPVYSLNLTVWNFEGTFKLVKLNVSLYNTVNYSKFGITNDLLRRALDVEHKRKVVLPDGWVVLEPVHAEAPGDLDDLMDYLGENPMAYSTILYRTEYYLSGRDTDVPPDGVPDWPMEIGLMPAGNYSCRISVQNKTQNAVDTGFRPADYNATVYWSGDPYPGVGPVEVSARKAVKQVVVYNIYTYIYDVPVQTLDASGQPLALVDHSAIILAEPYDLVLANDADLDITYRPRQLWYMQQYDEDIVETYNAYMVRFNSSDTNIFHSVNASGIEDSPFYDPDLRTNATEYPQESRYLIGRSTLESAGNYTFNVYYRGILVFNDSIPLENPYSIGSPSHKVTGKHKIVTSVYPYVFEATNSPLDGDTFGIANLEVEVFWAGLNTSWWPTVNLTYRTAAEEFALLNASKLYKRFNTTVVERQWGNVTGLETQEGITYTTFHAALPYYSSVVIVVNGTTDSNGEFKCMVPVWNYSIGLFPTLMGTYYNNATWLGDLCPTLTASDRVLNPALEGATTAPFNGTLGGPRLPWVEATDTVNLTYRTTSLFGTPVFVNYTTIPGRTNNVPALDDPRLVGVGPGYEPWVNYKSINATGLINPKKDDHGGVSQTIDLLGVRAFGTGVLVNNNASKLIYGDFQGRSPELALMGTGPYKEEGNKINPPQPVSNFFAKVDSKTLANDLWVYVEDYAGNTLAHQRVEIIRANYTFTRDDEEIVIPPTVLTVEYTPTEYDVYGIYGPVKIGSKPKNILWGFYDVIVRTANLSRVDNAKEELEDLQLYGNQWLWVRLEGGDIDWISEKLHLRWPAKLDVQIKAGDGSTPIERAWVFLLYGTNWAPEGATPGKGGFRYVPPNPVADPTLGLPSGAIGWGIWEIGANATAGLTDKVGFASSLYVGPGRAAGPLATSDFTVLNLGFNVWKDVYTVKVYYKYMGEDEIYGPVEGSVVWDTFTDQPQHRYIYLGVEPPATATGEDYSNAQHKIYAVRIWNLKITLVDQSASARPIANAEVSVERLGKLNTASDGSVSFPLAPAGTYGMTAMWQSKYNPSKVTISKSTIPLQTTVDQIVPATVYDAELQLVSPSGKPISGAEVSLAEELLGMTGADGKVVAPQVPSKYTEESAAYTVTAMWRGVDISPGPVMITASRTYILTATNVATMTVQVVGAQGQGLSAAQVDITNSAGTNVFSGVSNEQGIVNVEVPYDTYTVSVDYKGFTGTATSTIDTAAPAPTRIATSVFLEIFGQAMTFATFVLWIIVVVIVVLVLAVVVHEYHVWRRKRLPQLFGAPRVPGA